MVYLRDRNEIEAIRAAAQLVGETLAMLGREVRPGVTTAELDRLAEQFIRDHGGRPAFKGYRGFPATLCPSVNEEVVHAIPGPTTLREGDIVGIDVGVEKDGYFGDAARTFAVGEVGEREAKLLDACHARGAADRASRRRGPAIAWATSPTRSRRTPRRTASRSCARWWDTGSGARCTRSRRCRTIGPPARGPRLMAGQVLAIEPMVNVGGPDVVMQPDGWTVVTKDGSLSAHFEHTVAVGPNGPEILSDRGATALEAEPGTVWRKKKASRSKARSSSRSRTRCSASSSRTVTRCWPTSRARCGCISSRSFPGDKVTVELSPYDLTRGRIVYRYK